MPQMLMKHDEDPAKQIFKRVGDLKDFTLFGNQLLIGVYERPKITKSGIHLADVTVKEDNFQGKAGCILLKGPTAFVSDNNYNFAGLDVNVGDWVAIFVSDGRKIVVRDQLCRIVEDIHVRLKIPAPDVIF